MEGGAWPGVLNVQTGDLERVRRKIRLYSLVYDQVAVSTGDYLQSDRLCEIAKLDHSLWGKEGPIRISCPNRSLRAYREEKFDRNTRDPIWVGTPCKDMDEVLHRGRVDEKLGILTDLRTPLIGYDETIPKERLTKLAAQAARAAGLPGKIREKFEAGGYNYFNRDRLVQETQSDSSDDAVRRFLGKMSSYYYLNGAATLNAECGGPPARLQTFNMVYEESVTHAGDRLLKLLPKDKQDLFTVIEGSVKMLFAVFGVPFENVSTKSPDDFLRAHQEGKVFREVFWRLVEKATNLKDPLPIGRADTQDVWNSYCDAFGKLLGKRRKRDELMARGVKGLHNAAWLWFAWKVVEYFILHNMTNGLELIEAPGEHLVVDELLRAIHQKGRVLTVFVDKFQN
jgi:hypothetical protein